MRLAKNRAVIEATGDVDNLTLNSAVRLLSPPKEKAEKDDELRALWAEGIVRVGKLRMQFRKDKARCSDEGIKLVENFLAASQKCLDGMEELIAMRAGTIHT
jgi:hypothetical protein